uniref:Uncharacterized protein n=1 Tax=Anguilla anguilla TaxID=7936 RepID=A0A0E9U9A1_ANGAN
MISGESEVPSRSMKFSS